ncbi:MAG: class IV adenylate cyclase [Thermoanaerobaculia bacterium]
MGRNVEIKVRVGGESGPDPGELLARVEALADDGPHLLRQQDTFFECARGRLKLRQLGDGGEAQLIHYQRSDGVEPRESRYVLAPVGDPASLAAALTGALGMKGIVRKQRTLYRIGQTRVHFDEVEGLGSYLELEVVLGPEQSQDEGLEIVRELMRRLGIPRQSLVAEAYVDLLTALREFLAE